MSDPAAERDELQPTYLLLFLIGGLCTGTGILNLYWAFGWEHGPLSSDFKAIGFSGLDNIELLPAADFAIPLVVVGVLCLILANAMAWKDTDGY